MSTSTTITKMIIARMANECRNASKEIQKLCAALTSAGHMKKYPRISTIIMTTAKTPNMESDLLLIGSRDSEAHLWQELNSIFNIFSTKGRTGLTTSIEPLMETWIFYGRKPE